MRLAVEKETSAFIKNSDYQLERKVITHKTYDRIYMSGNSKLTPSKLAEKIKEVEKNAISEGWFDLQTSSYTEPGNDDQLEREYVVISGSHTETDDEYEKRMKWIISNWQREYEEHLRMIKFYDAPLGKARIAEIKARSERPIRS